MRTTMTFALITFALLFRGTAQAKRFPSDMPAAARQQIVALETGTRFDPQRNLFATDDADAAARQLAGGVSSTYDEVKAHALGLLAELLDEREVSRGTLDVVVGAVRQAAASAAPGSPVAEAAARALWQAEYRLQPQGEERLRYLQRSLDASGPAAEYVAARAANHLASIGDAKARQALAEKLSRGRARSASEDVTASLSAAVQKIDAAAAKDPAEKSRRLLALVQPPDGQAVNELSVWAVRQLGRVAGTEAEAALRGVWKNARLDDQVRYEAQEILLARGSIKTIERTIAFQ